MLQIKNITDTKSVWFSQYNLHPLGKEKKILVFNESVISHNTEDSPQCSLITKTHSHTLTWPSKSVHTHKSWRCVESSRDEQTKAIKCKLKLEIWGR